MKAEIISVGTEILMGSTINTDAADVSQVLSEYGISVHWHSVVGDNPGRVEQAVINARERADIIITTGGLGPTYDDLTKAAVAKAFGLELRLDKEAEGWMLELFKSRSRPIDDNNYQQVMLPEGSTPLQNDVGTAPGCMFKKGGVTVIMLPGPPRECRYMLENRVRPLLSVYSDGIIASHNIKFTGIGEGAMEYRIRDYMDKLLNPSLAPYAKEDECLLRVTAKADTLEKAEEMMRPVIAHVQEVFGDLVYGIDSNSLAARVMELLFEHEMTLATAESCTGGELAKRLTDVPGASRSFLGGVVAYTSMAKEKILGIPLDFTERYGPVSREVAEKMADAARERLGTDIGVSITGLAGPGGDGVNEVGTVFICVSTPEGKYMKESHRPAFERDRVRRNACQTALDMVRRYLIGAEIVPEG